MPSTLSDDQYLYVLGQTAVEAIVVASINPETGSCLIIRVNEVAQTVFGRPREALIGASIDQLVSPRLRGGDFYREIVAEPANAAESCATADGQRVCVTADGRKSKLYGWNQDRGVEFPLAADIGYAKIGGELLVIARLQDDSERVALREGLIAERERLRESKERAERALELREELDELKETQEKAIAVQLQNVEAAELARRQIFKLAGAAKVIVPFVVALLSVLSEYGQEKLGEINRARRNAGTETITLVNPSVETLPVLASHKEAVTAALEAFQGDADLALFGHYDLREKTGRIDFQARRSSVPLATQDPWSIVDEQPFKARAERHLEGSCYTVDSPAERLASVAYQISCPVLFTAGEGQQVAFVALEYKTGRVNSEKTELRVKDLAIAVQAALAESGEISGGSEHATNK